MNKQVLKEITSKYYELVISAYEFALSGCFYLSADEYDESIFFEQMKIILIILIENYKLTNRYVENNNGILGLCGDLVSEKCEKLDVNDHYEALSILNKYNNNIICN